MSPTYKTQERQLIRNELIASLVSVRNILILDQIKIFASVIFNTFDKSVFYCLKVRTFTI